MDKSVKNHTSISNQFDITSYISGIPIDIKMLYPRVEIILKAVSGMPFSEAYKILDAITCMLDDLNKSAYLLNQRQLSEESLKNAKL